MEHDDCAPLPRPDGMDQVRVRFAPNGEVAYAAFFTRTILYTWLFARRYGGAFVLRLDDTDLDRQIPGALDSYGEGMRWLGLDWDEGPEVGGDFGPYRQSQRRHLYREAVEKLLDEGKAYHCYCDRERLDELAARSRRREGGRPYDGRCRDLSAASRRAAIASGIVPSVRLRVPDDGEIVSHDMIRGDVVVKADRLNDYVISRPDGWPTYHLTVVVDDSQMRISHVLRGSEGVANMAPQAVMHDALGLPRPMYLHFPLVRAGDFGLNEQFLPTGVGIYLDELRRGGYLPQAVINYYAMLGQGYPGDVDIRSLDQLIEHFDYRRISRKDIIEQDRDKLEWMNRRYLQQAAPDADVAAILADRIAADLTVSARTAHSVLARALHTVRTRIAAAPDGTELLRFAFAPAPRPEPGMFPAEQADRVGAVLLRCAAVLEDGGRLGPVLAAAAAEGGPDRGALTRCAITALTGGRERLGPDDIAGILGPHEAARRLRRAGAILEARV